MRSIWYLMALLALVTAPLSGGCSDDDGGTGPTPNQNIPEEVAIEQAEGAVDLATSLIVSVGRLANITSEEDFYGLGSRYFLFKRATEPVETVSYVGGQWNYSYLDAFTEGEMDFDIDFAARLQFRDVMTGAQPFPDETTASMSYDVTAAVGFTSRFIDPDTEEVSTLGIATDYRAEVDVSGFLDEAFAIAGRGAQRIGIAVSTPEGDDDYLIDMDWVIDVTAPHDGSCPTGTVDIGFGPYEILVSFDGTSLASWTLYDGAAWVAEGSQELECGFPTAAH